MRGLRYAAFLAVGLGLGFGLRAAWEPGREARMLALMEDICLPHVMGQAPNLDHMRQIGIPSDAMFLDMETKAVVQMTVGTGRAACAISDMVDPLRGAAYDGLVTGARDFAGRHLPGMPLRDLTTDMGWALFLHWGVVGDHAPGTMNLLVTDFGTTEETPGVQIEVVRFRRADIGA